MGSSPIDYRELGPRLELAGAIECLWTAAASGTTAAAAVERIVPTAAWS